MSQYSTTFHDALAPIVQLFGKCIGGDARIQPRWEIPEKVAIKVAVVGTIWDREQNPYQPYTTQETREEAMACIDAGACSIHLHVRDEHGNVTHERRYYREIIDPIRKKYGDRVHFDGESVFGATFEDAMAPIREGLFESSAVNTTATYVGDTLVCMPPSFLKAQTTAIQQHNCKAQIAVYNLGDVDNADRYLIKTGILKQPYEWLIVPGLPGCTPMPNPVAMCEGLLPFIYRIREIDPAKNPMIVVSAGGRASSYLTAFAIMLGLHVRIGMEDTVWRYPHRDELLKNNSQVVADTVHMARLLGREPATADEYRTMIGLK